MDHEQRMRQAIAVAKQSQASHGVAIGAVLVDATGTVVATGGSQVGSTHDPTAHAEVQCIRAAALQRGSDDLFGLTLYSTLEPCHMCLSAAAWARIPTVIFGAYRKDVDPSLFDITGNFSDEAEASRMNLRTDSSMHVTGGVLEKQCAELLAGYHDFKEHGATHV